MSGKRVGSSAISIAGQRRTGDYKIFHFDLKKPHPARLTQPAPKVSQCAITDFSDEEPFAKTTREWSRLR
jgi:hypothetical protein